MKYELKKGTLGIIDWLSGTSKNPLLLGGAFGISDVAEACWIFTVDLMDVEKMTPQKVKAEVKRFMADLDADAFNQMQKHAEIEIKKFFTIDHYNRKDCSKLNHNLIKVYKWTIRNPQKRVSEFHMCRTRYGQKFSDTLNDCN